MCALLINEIWLQDNLTLFWASTLHLLRMVATEDEKSVKDDGSSIGGKTRIGSVHSSDSRGSGSVLKKSPSIKRHWYERPWFHHKGYKDETQHITDEKIRTELEMYYAWHTPPLPRVGATYILIASFPLYHHRL